MLHTPLCDLLGCQYPILLAGMGGVSRHQLAAAVARAGGFAKLGMVREPPCCIRYEVSALRRLSDKPFAVNLIPAATESKLLKEQIKTCLELEVPFLELFWEVDRDLVRHLKAEGVGVLHQVGNQRDAKQALDAGADVLIAQGFEAGGHVHGTISTLILLAELIPMSPLPIVASGGIANGRTMVAALAMGAQGVNLGTAFLATEEANAHRHHKQRIIDAKSGDTIYTRKFWKNWHQKAPVRVLANRVTQGDYDDYKYNEMPEIIGYQDEEPVYLFSTDSPLADATGEVDNMALYAGQSCGQIAAIVPAGKRIDYMIEEATYILNCRI